MKSVFIFSLGFFVLLNSYPAMSQNGEFGQLKLDLETAMEKSILDPSELADHAINRMTYGPSSMYVSMDTLILDANKKPLSRDDAISKIATFVARQILSENSEIDNEPLNLALAELKAFIHPSSKLTGEFCYKLSALSHVNDTNAVAIAQQLTGQENRLRDEAKKFNVANPGNEIAISAYVVGLRRFCMSIMTYDRIVRAMYSKNQFKEKLVDFWMDHLNVEKKKVGLTFVNYYKEVIPNHTHSKLENLILASAQSAAMMHYLDNASSKFDKKNLLAINENYGREIMELHTFGVGPTSGIYDQETIRSASLLLSGWGVGDSSRRKLFAFRPDKAFLGEVSIFGTKFEGEKGGINFIKFISNHDHTYKNIAQKLVHKFVWLRRLNNTPEANAELRRKRNEIITSILSRLKDKKGSLQEAYKAMIAHEHFWSREAYRSKVKRPMDFAVASARLLALAPSDIFANDKKPLNQIVNFMDATGHEIFSFPEPTGFPDTNRDWSSPHIVTAKTQFALAFTTRPLDEGIAPINLASFFSQMTNKFMGSLAFWNMKNETLKPEYVLAQHLNNIIKNPTNYGKNDGGIQHLRSTLAAYMGSRHYDRH